MQTYLGFNLNEKFDANWVNRELTNFQSIIDLLGVGPDFPNTAGNERLYSLCLGTGRLGIGMSSNQVPASPCHVYGGASGQTPWPTTLLTLEDNLSAVMQFLSPNNTSQGFYFGDAVADNVGTLLFNHAVAGDYFSFNFAGTQYARFDTTGLAVGAALTPAHLLHIEGSAYRGYILQDDATGAVEPLYLRQADTDVQIMHFRGYKVDATITSTLVDQDDATETIQGYVRIYVTDDSTGDPIDDGEYYLPIYSLA